MRYQVQLSFTQQSAATITIEAESLDHAHDLADALRPDEIQDWRPINGDLQIIQVIEAPAARPAPPSTQELVEALQWILEHSMDDEAADYRSRDSAEEREGHIYNALCTVARWLASQSPA